MYAGQFQWWGPDEDDEMSTGQEGAEGKMAVSEPAEDKGAEDGTLPEGEHRDLDHLVDPGQSNRPSRRFYANLADL